MEINGVDLMQSLWRTYGTGFDTSLSSVSKDDALALCGKPTDRIDISMFGKFNSEVSQLSNDEKEELRAFFDEMMEAVKNGTFDASEMATNAPDALKAFAEENGIDLETLLADQAAMAEKGPMRIGPPPPMPADGSENSIFQLSEEEMEESRAFFDEMMEAVKNGTFDASEMATNAPDALKAFAEENGIDLETLLADQAARIEDYGTNGAPPPLPSILHGNDGYGKTYSS